MVLHRANLLHCPKRVIAIVKWHIPHCYFCMYKDREGRMNPDVLLCSIASILIKDNVICHETKLCAHLFSSPAETHSCECTIPMPITARMKQNLFFSIEKAPILSVHAHLLIWGSRMKEMTFQSHVTALTPIGGNRRQKFSSSLVLPHACSQLACM